MKVKKLNESFVNVLPTDDNAKDKYIDEVWKILVDSYDYLGGPLKTRDDIMGPKYFWKLVRRGGKITAAAIYKLSKTQGRKLVLCGKNYDVKGSTADLFSIVKEDINLADRNAWMEVSDKMEDRIRGMGYIPLPNTVAEKILAKLGKKLDSLDDDGEHYTRKIGGQLHTKVMFGNPPKSMMESYDYRNINYLECVFNSVLAK